MHLSDCSENWLHIFELKCGTTHSAITSGSKLAVI